MVTNKIKLGGNEYMIIDLTQPLSLDQEVYPGDSKPKRIVFSDIEKTGWHHYIHELGDHHFQPHADAPNHQNPDMMEKGIEIFDVSYSFNPAFLIDLSNDKNAKETNGIIFLTEITLAHLKPFEHFFSQKGAVLIRTGYDKWLKNNYPHHPEMLPYLTGKAAEYLASFKNLKVVGTDSLTVDPHGSHTAHQFLKEKMIVESMVNLHAIPNEKRTDFDLQTSPVRIIGATGGPVIANAFIEI
jgi:kynurenine formamidase